ncbi:MAG: stress-induced acidophilic repeat motif-containing protein [Agromyces sp.]
MADPENEGQFGNREDTEEQARKGGEASSGKFGSEHGADPVEAGRKGGEHSHGGGRDDEGGSDDAE